MSEIKLFPCPFCGSELIRNMRNLYEHDKSGCILDGFEFPEEQIEKWNTRKPVDDVLERLEEECVEYKNTWNKYDDEVAFGQMNGMSNAISIIKEGLMLEEEE